MLKFGLISGPPRTVITYQPLEASPDWDIIYGGASNTGLVGDTVTMFSDADDKLVGKDQAIFTNGSVSADILLLAEDNSAKSFILGARMQSNGDYIGLRTYSGNLEIYDYIGGFFKLGEISQAGLSTPLPVTLSVNGSVISVNVDGDVHEFTTTLLTSGAWGLVSRLWTVVQKTAAKNYVVISG